MNSALLYELAYYWRTAKDVRFLSFLKALLRRQAPGRQVLDCACGTGEPGIHLADQFIISLSDSSESMLRIARAKAAAKGLLDLPFHNIAWKDLGVKLSERFDAVICSGNAISQCLDAVSRRAALRGMAEVLIPDGFFYCDFRDDIPSKPTGQFKAVEATGPILWRRQAFIFVVYEKTNAKFLSRKKVCYAIRAGRLSSVASVISRYCPIVEEVFRKELHEAGFVDVRFLRRPGRWPLTAVTATKKK